jgi:esterase/lipase
MCSAADEKSAAGARWTWAFALLVAALTTLAIFGPRVEVSATVRPAILPADLDAYLATSETAIPVLRPEARRRIVWHDPGLRQRTRYAVVYLHGFSASAPELAPLPQQVARALGANLYLARLRGHGQDAGALGKATANEWLADAADAYAIGARLGERVVVIGASTGATLAVWLATRPGLEKLHALVLMAPNFGAADPRERLLRLPLAEQLVPLLVPTHGFEPRNAEQGRHWTTSYPSPVLLQLAALVAHVSRLPLETIAVPTLTFYAPGDKVIDVSRMLAAHDRVARASGARKELVVVGDSDDPLQHTLAGDILSPSTTSRVAEAIGAFLMHVASDLAARSPSAAASPGSDKIAR